jgi:hypothetical protein
LPGGKRKRQNADGTSPGGLEWDNRVVLNTVLLYTLSHTSLKEAGSAGLSFLSRKALECYVKAQPLSGHQSRRIDSENPMPLFKQVSTASVRCCTAALSWQKTNDQLFQKQQCSKRDQLFQKLQCSIISETAMF